MRGWKRNNKLPRAEPIQIKIGLDKFEAMYQGWQLANLINSKDVS
jgi:hypothetical protein